MEEKIMNLELKNQIDGLLLSTDRKGIEDLITYMNENGFYTAPCSSQYHLAKEGGLAEHSLNVYKTMKELEEALAPYNTEETKAITYDSVVITAILHDLGKMGQFGKQNYVPNMIQDRKSKEMVQSEKKPFETNKDLLPIPHEIRSIQIASQFIELTEEENFAVLHHNGMYGDLKYQLSGKETPLQMLLHWADMWTSRVVEVNEK